MRRNLGVVHVCLVLPVLLGMIVGCQQGNSTTLTGKVTLDGKPIENGTISLIPADGNTATAGTRITNGEYSLALPPGTKRVEISAAEVVSRRAAYQGESNSPQVDVMKSIIPARYNRESELSIEIKSGSNQRDFDLES